MAAKYRLLVTTVISDATIWTEGPGDKGNQKRHMGPASVKSGFRTVIDDDGYVICG